MMAPQINEALVREVRADVHLEKALGQFPPLHNISRLIVTYPQL